MVMESVGWWLQDEILRFGCKNIIEHVIVYIVESIVSILGLNVAIMMYFW